MEIRDANPASARTIKASEFKAKRLKLMDEVADSGVGIVITRNAPTVHFLPAPAIA